ncbi:MAG: hypothetical protein COV52_01985 [Gammaproteobacteria bacterium CG11_big_fil_rev_8_21_14_0_20_46_22]|nr:MAG: hypothetical protein COW05_05880 [Gammaproteobacteria bacterium CG12_big_fil_rev_8_21_14_0_65_46_12]PIR11885.1 MAG: hypothetical protein COV52_01985 [Gammaproteobacteria bacterium CG11_big_fil_rev_8_21_14_0_20_46_22]
MYQTAIRQANQPQIIHLEKQESGVLTHIELNYHELICIELALIGFEELIHQIDQQGLDVCYRNNIIPYGLMGVSVDHLKAQLRYLKHWANKPALKDQLRYDGKNTVSWSFTSSELVDWLLCVCQSCISIDAILIRTYDSASEEYADFKTLYLEHDEDQRYTLADDMQYSNISTWQHYYNDIVNTCQLGLVRKLATIKLQDYPLFPKFSLIN